MRVFVTGATGFIGSAVVRELLSAGHQVTGLARSDKAAAAVEAAGAQVFRGSLEDTGGLAAAAAAADGVIHTGYIHDFSATGNPAAAAAVDGAAIAAVGEALGGTGKPFVVASGLPAAEPGQVVTEEVAATENPHWPRVSEVERVPAGTLLNAIGDEGVPFRDIAETIGRHLDVPVKSITAEESARHFGTFAAFAAFDVPASSARTRERFGWRPVEPGLIADLDQGHYFTVPDHRRSLADGDLVSIRLPALTGFLIPVSPSRRGCWRSSAASTRGTGR
ncbi:MAG TPA: NAD-dependent epimerase/dehydratase family protein [Trebonia sp.]|nr:NAD-dependent epimerase/dehydratase family protein [Trebonia sp.]